MTKFHNKKRNVGIIYEQIVIFICNRLLENNKKDAEIATNIIAKHFKKNTQRFITTCRSGEAERRDDG